MRTDGIFFVWGRISLGFHWNVSILLLFFHLDTIHPFDLVERWNPFSIFIFVQRTTLMKYMSFFFVINTKSLSSVFHLVHSGYRTCSVPCWNWQCLLVQLRLYQPPYSINIWAHNNTRHSKGFLKWSESTIQCCPCFKVAVASWLPKWASLLHYHPSWKDSLI